MAWFRKDKKPLKAEDKRDVPSDLFDKCKGCGDILYAEKLIQNFKVCPACGYHFRITSDKYLEILVDEGSDRTGMVFQVESYLAETLEDFV